jgi:CRISP-associated protein Cas1
MSILPTHKDSIVYLEHCKISVKEGMVVLTRKKDAFEKILLEKHFSIRYGNINALILGSGTSLSQQAARLLSGEGVSVAFTGGGGMPIFLASQSEYRKPEFLQGWIKMWLNEGERLKVAKGFQMRRCALVKESWKMIFENEIDPTPIIEKFQVKSAHAKNNFELLGHEGDFTKALFRILAQNVLQKEFKRKRSGNEKNTPNQFLKNGNYLAYGLGAAALWILGIPHSLPVSHGSTRRGALVFDMADLIKDACIMPFAFLSVAQNNNFSHFRKNCISWIEKMDGLKVMLEEIKKVTDIWNQKEGGNLK